VIKEFTLVIKCGLKAAVAYNTLIPDQQAAGNTAENTLPKLEIITKLARYSVKKYLSKNTYSLQVKK